MNEHLLNLTHLTRYAHQRLRVLQQPTTARALHTLLAAADVLSLRQANLPLSASCGGNKPVSPNDTLLCSRSYTWWPLKQLLPSAERPVQLLGPADTDEISDLQIQALEAALAVPPKERHALAWERIPGRHRVKDLTPRNPKGQSLLDHLRNPHP